MKGMEEGLNKWRDMHRKEEFMLSRCHSFQINLYT